MPEIKETSLENPFGTPIYHITSCDSTMTEIQRLESLDHGTVLYTDYQSRGRGRGSKRSWISKAGENLLFTITMNPSRTAHPLVLMPLICGLALCDLLDDLGINNILKWPNDVLAERKKIAGILCEYKSSRLFAGIGINCGQNLFPDDIAHKSTSLSLLNSPRTDVSEILPLYLKKLKVRAEEKDWKTDAQAKLYGMGQKILIKEGPADDSRDVEITVTGLSDEGYLLVKDSSGCRQIGAGEIAFPEFR